LLDKSILDRYRFDAEGLAKEFSKNYFSSHERQFPINPFQVLSELTVPFVFRNLKGILKLKKTQFVLVPSKDKGKPGFDKHDCKEKMQTREFWPAMHDTVLCDLSCLLEPHDLVMDGLSIASCGVSELCLGETGVEAVVASKVVDAEGGQKRLLSFLGGLLLHNLRHLVGKLYGQEESHLLAVGLI